MSWAGWLVSIMAVWAGGVDWKDCRLPSSRPPGPTRIRAVASVSINY